MNKVFEQLGHLSVKARIRKLITNDRLAYVVNDTFSNRIRKVSTDGVIITVAGVGSPSFSGDQGPATQAELNKHGFDAKVVEMKGHDHNYYAVSKDLNPKIWDFLLSNKKWWLTPIILALLLVGALILLSGTVAAPFIYTLF